MSGCRYCALCEGVIGDAGSLHHTAAQRGRGEQGPQLPQERGGGEGVVRGHHPHSEVRGTWAGFLVRSSQLKDFQKICTSGSVTSYNIFTNTHASHTQ